MFMVAILAVAGSAPASELRVGIIGLDSSHAVAFTEILNNATNKNHVLGAKVVAAFQGGSPDIPTSLQKAETNAAVLRDKYGVKIYDTIAQVGADVDAILIESVDGRAHLPQVKAILPFKKPVFIDKPLGGNLSEVLEIIRLTQAEGIPMFTASALRFAKNTQAARHGSIGRVQSAETSSPANLEPHHPDLYWYGIHGCESLFTVMGTGCESVTRGATADGGMEVIGTWKDGRRGVFRSGKSYAGMARGETGAARIGAFDGYAPLVGEIVKFFQTHQSPVPIEETIELFAFMSAADLSKERNGATVTLAETLAAARASNRTNSIAPR